VTRVTAPSRLHFGLLSLPVDDPDQWPGIDAAPGLPVRHFGGVGLMIDQPGIIVRAAPADEWLATGPLGPRAMAFAVQFIESLPETERRPFRITVERAADEHTGLGTGTQLGLAVAKAIAVETGHADWPATELGRCVGRGERSAIGMHGFDRGGLIVEGGKLAGEAVSPLVGRYAFPAEWGIVLFTPPGAVAWHGGRERSAFAQISQSSAAADTETLCRIVLTGLLPALSSTDLDAFGDALYEFNARAGDAFAEVQGGRYGSPAVAECVRRLRAAGARGTGQSSWGPTVFAVVRREDVADVVRKMRDAPAIVAGASAGAVVG
jgi:beta-ribofuranosylaminobenzene 5'-phosphate synthase